VWWAEALTRTAPPEVAADRRAEIASDLHEQLAAGSVLGLPERWLSRCVAGRVVRGLPNDVLWRVQLELAAPRMGWHLQNPSTVIAFLLVIALPINFLADAAPSRIPALLPAYALSWATTLVVAWGLLCFGAASGLRRLAPGAPKQEPRLLLPLAARLRRAVTAVMGVSWALSVIGKLSATPALSAVATAGWMLFGLSLACYVALLVVTAAHRVLTLGR